MNLPAAMQGLVVMPLFAGYDLTDGLGKIYEYDITGGTFVLSEKTPYSCTGSGGERARATFEHFYKDGMNEQEAVELVEKALTFAAKRDAATGGKDFIVMAISKEGIRQVRPGASLGDVGHAIQSYAEAQGFSVVRDFCGHGLGRVFHDAPSVLHYGQPGQGTVLREGMFFTIEPMINAGKPHVKVLDDGWTAVTRDRSLSAQFEHSLGVTADGVEVFTLSPKGWQRPPYQTP